MHSPHKLFWDIVENLCNISIELIINSSLTNDGGGCGEDRTIFYTDDFNRSKCNFHLCSIISSGLFLEPFQ